MKKLITLMLAALLVLNLTACGGQELELGTVAVDFSENVVLSDQGEVIQAAADQCDLEIGFYTDGKSVQDVLLETGHMNEDASDFVPEKTVCSAALLGPNDALLVKVPYFETMPNLRLTYTGANGTARFYVTQSGKDGSLVLVDAG